MRIHRQVLGGTNVKWGLITETAFIISLVDNLIVVLRPQIHSGIIPLGMTQKVLTDLSVFLGE